MRYFPLRQIPQFIVLVFLSSVAYGQARTDKSILKTKGTWINPVDKIIKIDTSGPCYDPCDLPNYSLRIKTDSSRLARFIQPGKVALVTTIGDAYAVITRESNFFLVYSGLKSVSVNKGDSVTIGQNIGPLMEMYSGFFELELSFSHGSKSEKRLQDWFTDDFRILTRSAN